MESIFGFVSWLALGALVGWASTVRVRFGRRDQLDDVLAGACAAALAGTVFAVLSGRPEPFAWDGPGFVVAFGGAMAIFGVLGLVRRA